MSKKELTAEEREKLGQEIVEGLNSYDDNDILKELVGASKKPRDLSKTTGQKLTKYHILVEEIVAWSSRQTFLELLKNFLSKKIDGETFSSKFFRLREEDMDILAEICEKIEEGIKPIPDLYYTAKAADFSSVMNDLFFTVEAFDPDIEENEENLDLNACIYGEKTLRLMIQTNTLPKLEKYYDLDD